jgi:hypothetical protein
MASGDGLRAPERPVGRIGTTLPPSVPSTMRCGSGAVSGAATVLDCSIELGKLLG